MDISPGTVPEAKADDPNALNVEQVGPMSPPHKSRILKLLTLDLLNENQKSRSSFK